MKIITDEKNKTDRYKVFNYETNQWEKIPGIANIGELFEKGTIDTEYSEPIRSGINYDKMGMFNWDKYDDALYSLTLPQYRLFQIIKKQIKANSITVKLNNSIVKKLLNIKADSNASVVLNGLVKSGLVLQLKGYKDLYCLNPNMCFRGDYNSFAIDYYNKDYNKNNKNNKPATEEESTLSVLYGLSGKARDIMDYILENHILAYNMFINAEKRYRIKLGGEFKREASKFFNITPEAIRCGIKELCDRFVLIQSKENRSVYYFNPIHCYVYKKEDAQMSIICLNICQLIANRVNEKNWEYGYKACLGLSDISENLTDAEIAKSILAKYGNK